MVDDDDPWFEPKRYGYGAGLPIVWQGWVLLGFFIAAMVLAGLLLMPGQPIAYAATVVILIAALSFIAARKTRGGWRWRSDKED